MAKYVFNILYRHSRIIWLLPSTFIPAYVGFALVAAVTFAVRAVIARGGASYLSLPHVLILQSALSLPILAAMAKLKAVSLVRTSANKKVYAWRISSSLAYMLLLLYSLKIMPAILASTLSYTAPLFTAMLAPRLLHKRTTPAIVGVMVTGFLGHGITTSPVSLRYRWLVSAQGYYADWQARFCKFQCGS